MKKYFIESLCYYFATHGQAWIFFVWTVYFLREISLVDEKDDYVIRKFFLKVFRPLKIYTNGKQALFVLNFFLLKNK